MLYEKIKEDATKREKKQRKRGLKEPTEAEYDAMVKARDNAVPPVMLLPTASPYAFLSKSIATQTEIDPNAIFPPQQTKDRPALFRQNMFVYKGVESFQKGSESKASQYSEVTVPQVAFLGRSNVGKSSLVNALMRQDLARCSKQPGRTQQVHRFALVAPDDNKAKQPFGLFLDLPGYGFAVAPDDVLDNWQAETQRVLLRESKEGNLKRIFLLIDARQGVTKIDYTVLDWLQEKGRIPHTLVWTKSDAVSQPELIKGLNQAFLWHHHRVFRSMEDGDTCWMGPIIHTTSTKGSGMGLMELLAAIEVEFLVDDQDEDGDTDVEVDDVSVLYLVGLPFVPT